MVYSVIILIASVFISRWILLSAFKELSDDMKEKVLSGNVTRISQITLATTILMVIAFCFMVTQYPHFHKVISVCFFIAIVLQRLFAYFFTQKNMVSNNIPETYIKKYLLSWLITTAGVVIFILLFVGNSN